MTENKYTLRLEEDERVYILEATGLMKIDEVVHLVRDFLIACTFTEEQVDAAMKKASDSNTYQGN